MEIKGKVHCFFEQIGTFKNEFIKLGIQAEDYDIQNNFGQTDHVIDLFAEIENAYRGGQSIFDTISCDDLIIAFFPCIYFECMSMMLFNWGNRNYSNLSLTERTQKIIERECNRHYFYDLLLKLVYVVTDRKIRMIFENPWALQHFLKQGNFVKNPDIVDEDRTRRGDVFIKPTAYWFFGCEPTRGFTNQQTPPQKIKNVCKGTQLGGEAKKSPIAGLCSEERSMMTPDYARNFICDFVIGKYQQIGQLQIPFEE